MLEKTKIDEINFKQNYNSFNYNKESLIILARFENDARKLDYEMEAFEVIGYKIDSSGFKVLAFPLGKPKDLFHFTWINDDIKDELDIIKAIETKIPFNYCYR